MARTLASAFRCSHRTCEAHQPCSQRASLPQAVPAHRVLQLHDLVALKVGEPAALQEALASLRGVRRLELFLDPLALPAPPDHSVAGTAGKVFDDEFRQRHEGESDGLAGHRLVLFQGRAVYECLMDQQAPARRRGSVYAFVVNDFDDCGDAALVGALVEQDDAADFDQAPLRSLDLNVGHLGCDEAAMVRNTAEAERSSTTTYCAGGRRRSWRCRRVRIVEGVVCGRTGTTFLRAKAVSESTFLSAT